MAGSYDFLIALDQVIDDALRVQELVGRLLAHPGREAREIVFRQPDRHRQVFMRRAEFELEVIVEPFEQVFGHGVMVNFCVDDVAITSPPLRADTDQVCTSGSSATVVGNWASVVASGALSHTVRLPVTATILIT